MTAGELSLSEEDLAYTAKNPAQRVEVFLRIADRRVEAARKALKNSPDSDIESSLKGYLSAFQGAQMGVSWGQSLGMNMQRQATAISKATRRHLLILEKLESTASQEQRGPLLRIKQALTRELTSADSDVAGCAKAEPTLIAK